MAARPITPADIDAWLPQTQCQQCEYPSCTEYADAIHRGAADINQCPPGGAVTIDGLAALLERPTQPLNTKHGAHRPRTLARIVESDCIGCTLCIDACPVDAIAGAGKHMHTVIIADCTGCELCVPACPVDCIELDAVPIHDGERWAQFRVREVQRARRHFQVRLERLARHREQREAHRAKRRAQSIRAEIAAAVARVRTKRGTLT
jgi:electron transport complex protein RnfB